MISVKIVALAGCLSVISARSTSHHTTISTTPSTSPTTIPYTSYSTTSTTSHIITSSAASSSTLAITTTLTTTSTVPPHLQFLMLRNMVNVVDKVGHLVFDFHRLLITSIDFTGGTICPIDWICTVANEFFSQCLPGPNYTFPPTPTPLSATVSPYPIQTWDYVFSP
jgi:hypothetical protein